MGSLPLVGVLTIKNMGLLRLLGLLLSSCVSPVAPPPTHTRTHILKAHTVELQWSQPFTLPHCVNDKKRFCWIFPLRCLLVFLHQHTLFPSAAFPHLWFILTLWQSSRLFLRVCLSPLSLSLLLPIPISPCSANVPSLYGPYLCDLSKPGSWSMNLKY